MIIGKLSGPVPSEFSWTLFRKVSTHKGPLEYKICFCSGPNIRLSSHSSPLLRLTHVQGLLLIFHSPPPWFSAMNTVHSIPPTSCSEVLLNRILKLGPAGSCLDLTNQLASQLAVHSRVHWGGKRLSSPGTSGCTVFYFMKGSEMEKQSPSLGPLDPFAKCFRFLGLHLLFPTEPGFRQEG